VEECLKGYICAQQIQEPCSFGMTHVVHMKAAQRNKNFVGDKLPPSGCKYGVLSNSQKDCHCMWKMMDNLDERPMTPKEIAKALCLTVEEVEENIEKALLKLRKTDDAIEWVEQKVQGVDLYEGLTHHIDDFDFFVDASMSEVTTSISADAEDVPSGEKRGRAPRKSQSSVPVDY
jgi:hypothetical protein